MSIKKIIKGGIKVSPLLAILIGRVYTICLAMKAAPYSLFPKLHCFISMNVKVTGWRQIELGKNVVLSSGTWLNVNHRIANIKSLRIMDNSFVGRNNFFTVGNAIVLREYCLTASECSFIGSSHNINNPFNAYIATGTSDTNKIYVGVNCFFGYRSCVIGDVTIGHGSIIGACSTVLQSIPPFSMVVGSPARIIKHYSFEQSCWVIGERQSGEYPNEEEYLTILKQNTGFIIQPLSVAATIGGDI